MSLPSLKRFQGWEEAQWVCSRGDGTQDISWVWPDCLAAWRNIVSSSGLLWIFEDFSRNHTVNPECDITEDMCYSHERKQSEFKSSTKKLEKIKKLKSDEGVQWSHWPASSKGPQSLVPALLWMHSLLRHNCREEHNLYCKHSSHCWRWW